ncbi:peptidase M48 Ste24p [Emticicia oligotrophica DSM 17448]|uniref:Peptidase M48 Ste24p n=1 Tax=Emticicia oligotrophica (strain DSM 17448 / CIP 109782 / MTCC 6937 / GPTSA100-15) TaxID=929562 RepID=A0ABN4APE6_EMTOG|nr:M48 family metalloprotease [Emticicia oligotrophica]AFK03678.1 peptidase M48 Ste24p [Emticicia oligotrophica DSM 17448]
MQSSGLKFRFLIGIVMAIVALISYYSKNQVNPVTGEKQHIDLTPEQEVAMGLQSAPQMAQEYGGLYADNEVQQEAKAVGYKIVKQVDEEAKAKGVKIPYQFDFHVLADDQTVNAFALPGGQIFITVGLLKRLKSEDQLAGVLGHEVGHVIHRHSAQQMAKSDFYQGLVGAVATATSDGTGMGGGQIAQYVAQIQQMKFGRNDELQSDEFGVKYMIQAGYDPNAMIQVMEILEEASGGQQTAEFMSTHPSPENRIIKIKEHIAKYSKQ